MTELATEPVLDSPPPAPLWTRNFRFYFTARALSMVGDAMLPVALSVAVLDGGFGAGGVGYALGAWMVGLAVCTPFGGVLADRFTPLRMMTVAAVARLLVQATTAVLFATGTPALWHLVALQLASGVATAVFQPGTASLIPQVTGDVQRANASTRIAEALLGLGGPALAGVLVTAAGPAVVFVIDAAAFALCAGFLRLLRLAEAAAAPSGESMWQSLVGGWQEFRARTWLWSVIAVWSVYGLTVFGPALPLGADLIVKHNGAQGYGIVMAGFGAGAALGAVLGFRLKPQRPLAAGAVGMLGFVCYPLAPVLSLPTWAVTAGYLVAGAAMAFWGVMWSTTVQTRIPAHLLNRVYAYDVAGSLVVLSAGRVLAGPAASAVGTRPLLVLSSAVAAGCCLLLLAVPAIRTLRRAG